MTAKLTTCPHCGKIIDLGAEFARMGGQSKSDAKTEANRKRAARFWADVRSGRKPAPKHHCQHDGEELST